MAPRRSRALRDVLRRSALRQSLLIATVVAVALISTLQYQDLVEQERRAADAIVGITTIRSEMLNAEVSIRSYVLSADARAIDSFNKSPGVIIRTAASVQGDLSKDEFAVLAETVDQFEQWRQDYAAPAIIDVLEGRAADAEARIAGPQASTEGFRQRITEIESSLQAALQRVGDRLDTAAPISLVSMIVAGIAAIVVAFGLARRLNRQVALPIVALAADTRRLGEGDLSARSSANGVSEVDDISGAFNAMAARLEETVAGLQELDELKSEFVSMVSHELRTPLTSILGYTDALIVEEAGPLNDEQREYADAIDRNAKRLQSLVDDLLTLSRLDAGRLQLDIRPVDLGRIVSASCNDLRGRAGARGVRLSLDMGAEPTVAGDPDRLAQVIINLVSNAVKFTPSGKAVEVSVTEDGGDAVVSVRDEGVGIPAADLPRLFERFFRASTAGTVEGTGLGLAITKELVDMQGGTLEVASVEGEEGSTFTLRFPAIAEAAPIPAG